MKRKYTLKWDKPDERDLLFEDHHIYKSLKVEAGTQEEFAKKLPAKVDLRPEMPPVFDQGHLGSCTANSLCGLREYYDLKHGDATELSRLFLYWHEREMEGHVDEDSGASLRDGMKVLHKIGVCPERYFPYQIEHFADKPSEEAEQAAAKYRIKGYHRVRDLHGLKVALAHGMPVAFGMLVFESFESPEVAETGMAPLPQDGEQFLGGHAVLAVGYDDEMGCVIVRNSWGEQWGDKGYFYLPYEFFMPLDEPMVVGDQLIDRLVIDMWTAVV